MVENLEKKPLFSRKRFDYSMTGSILLLIVGVYCLFLKMAFPNWLYLVFGVLMVGSTFQIHRGFDKQTYSIVILFISMLIMLTLHDMVYSILDLTRELRWAEGDQNYISFAIVDRFIILLLSCAGLTLSVIGSMDNLLDGKKNSFLLKLAEVRIHFIGYLVGALLTIFAIGRVSLYLYVTRGIIDSLIFLPIFLGLLPVFYFSWWELNRGKYVRVVNIQFIIFTFFYAFLSLLNFFYFIISVINLMGMGAFNALTKEIREKRKNDAPLNQTDKLCCMIPILLPFRLLQQLIQKEQINKRIIRSLGVFVGFLLCIAGIVVPMSWDWEDHPIEITVEDHSQDIIEINWAYGSEMSKDWDWLARDEIADMIEEINNNTETWGINISVTIPIVRELFNETINPNTNTSMSDDVAEIFYALNNRSIVYDLMPIVDSAVLGDRDEYIHDDNIDEFKDVYYEMKDWLKTKNLTDSYRALVIDLERTTSIEINELVLNYMEGQSKHLRGQEKLMEFIQELIDKGELVAGAFFGFHIFDFVDADDAQQDFFMISIVPPKEWEFIAAMIYQYGEGSNMSLYSYCKDMNYHFGDKGVPYAVTMHSTYEDILTRLRIMKNSGFKKIGMWAMHELFANGTLFGMGSHKTGILDENGNEINHTWTPAEFIQLHEDLSEDGPVSFKFRGFNSENSYESLILLLDAWLYRSPVYTHGWPIMGERLPNDFLRREIIRGFSYAAMFLVGALISYVEYKKKQKLENIPTLGDTNPDSIDYSEDNKPYPVSE